MQCDDHFGGADHGIFADGHGNRTGMPGHPLKVTVSQSGPEIPRNHPDGFMGDVQHRPCSDMQFKETMDTPWVYIQNP